MSFTFKQFHITDEHCAMKVGTDGVLLGAWAKVENANNVLDIGCGCGLISLMAAQRAPLAQITGIEIDAEATNEAIENVKLSPYAQRITIKCIDAIEFAKTSTQKFDCILSNPPYYEEATLPPMAIRAKARHTMGGGLNFDALLHCIDLLLDKTNNHATFSVILPTKTVAQFINKAAIYGYSLIQQTDVVTRPNKPCKRALLSFSPHAAPLSHTLLILLNEEGKRSEQYQALCEDFYIK